MTRYQVWVHENILIGHVEAKSKTGALRLAKEMVRSEFPDDKRPCVFVCPISSNNYLMIAESNRKQGFGLKSGD
jgi:hypothetical protein